MTKNLSIYSIYHQKFKTDNNSGRSIITTRSIKGRSVNTTTISEPMVPDDTLLSITTTKITTETIITTVASDTISSSAYCGSNRTATHYLRIALSYSRTLFKNIALSYDNSSESHLTIEIVKLILTMIRYYKIWLANYTPFVQKTNK